MYDYQFNEQTKEYELLKCIGFGEYLLVGYEKKERDAYYWYCKMNGFEYDPTNVIFDDEQKQV
jgi:hypothetical protein